MGATFMNEVTLVTGGAGFIGSHLVDALARAGDRVVVVDDFNDDYDPVVKLANLGDALAMGTCELVEGDICDPAVLDRAFGEGVTRVAHLAAVASEARAGQAPTRATDVNVSGSVQVLEAARRHGVARVVLASSASVYGKDTGAPFRETAAAHGPMSSIAASKRAMELCAHPYAAAWGLDVVVLRYFETYGPRQRPASSVERMALALADGLPVPLRGDGAATHDYVHVSDIVAGTMAALAQAPMPARPFRIYNLASGDVATARRFVEELAYAFGVEVAIEAGPELPGDLPLSSADIGAARRELGYEPRVDLATGLGTLVAWLDSRGSG